MTSKTKKDKVGMKETKESGDKQKKQKQETKDANPPINVSPDILYKHNTHKLCSTFCINKPTWNCKLLPYRDRCDILKLISDRPLNA
jgi:hypothetical protein